ncbi:hypothetical protein GDO81_026750 [Engystomops pustulosus]|uniref:Colipase N-terminal domain-containing protein n=1 Tax=Engystomops pustulosus TaxID=76066 RepID=A0AAV6ZLZ6_ENGPU|nr:hypothetical protein GDO81_026750 [Engystomops pustulosus]
MAQNRISLILLFVCPQLCLVMANTGTDLENGEFCVDSAQCKSQCCLGQNPGTCEPPAEENEKCTPFTTNDYYNYCPCKSGLQCRVNKIFEWFLLPGFCSKT